MRDNSKKILLYLLAAHQQPGLVPQEEIKLLVEGLSEGGKRSLLHVLEQRQVLVKEEVGTQTYYRLTQVGEQELKAQFPALFTSYQDWDGSYTQILFLEAPHSDAGFRYLRQFLLDRQFVALQRGVYLRPGELDAETSLTLEKLYRGHVYVYQLQKWLLGDERQFLNNTYILQDIANTYSGVSNEISQMLNKKNKSLAASHQLKQQFLSVFDRYLTVLDHDLGLISFFYPQTQDASQILAQIKALGEHLTRQITQ